MNLAFIAIRYDLIGGTERDLYELTHQLAGFGHDVTVYCAQVRTDPPNGVKIVRIPIFGFGRSARLWSVAVQGPKMAFRGGHDLVYSFARCVKQDVVRCGGGLHCTYLRDIQALHSPLKRFVRSLSVFHRVMLWIERQQYDERNFREITAISRQVKKEVQSVFPHPDSKFRIIYDGIDLARFKAGGNGDAVRERFKIPADADLLLFVGKGFERKGLDTVLKSMSAVRSEAVYLLVVGADQHAARYEEEAKSLGLSDRVTLAGQQKGVEDFYAAADLLVLPSRQEAFGNVVLEAMACGVPAVVSRVSGASEVLTGSLEQGILESHDDAEALAGIVDRMLERDTHRVCSKEAAQVAKQYSLEKNAREIEAQCEALIGAKAGLVGAELAR